MVKGIRYLLVLAIIGIMGCSAIPVNQSSSSGDLERRVENLEQQMLVLQASGVGAATQIYARDCTGATSPINDDVCLTKNMADISTASAGDKCLVRDTVKGIRLDYQYLASGVTENYPWYVDDDSDGGTAGWKLMQYNGNGVLIIAFGDPENMPTNSGRSEKSAPTWCNYTGTTYHIVDIYAWADEDDYEFELLITNSSSDWDTVTEVDTDNFTISTNGTNNAVFYDSWNVTTDSFNDDTVAAGQCILLRDAGTGSAGFIYGYMTGFLY